MGIKGRDQEFGLKKLSYIDFKPLNMDRVLTMLFPRLRFGGYGTRRPPRKHELTVDDFAREYLNDPKMFVGFGDHPDVVERCASVAVRPASVRQSRASEEACCHASAKAPPLRRHTRPRVLTDAR
jgi:hypothetical protein